MRSNLIPSRVAIRNERMRRGLEVKEVAEKIGITPAALSRIEAGTRTPKITTLRNLATLFGIKVEELLDEEPPPAAAGTPATLREGAA